MSLVADAPEPSVATVSATVPDWSRERPRHFLDAGRKLLGALRDDARVGGRGRLRRRLISIRHRFWSLLSQCDIALGTRIEGGLLMPHPNGIVVHPASVIGPNCLLMQQVTIGVGSGSGSPRLGGHVDVGAGAKLLGPITIGDHAVIGANAVVTKDVPPCAVMAGIPARQIATRRP